MVLMVLLTVIAIILAVVAFAFLSLGGAVGFILFGDIIVCIALIAFIIKKLKNK